MKHAFTVLAVLLLTVIPMSASGTDSRSDEFCSLAAKYFAAFIPSSPEKQVRTGRCVLGQTEKGEVDIYFPTLGTDSLERERIVTVAVKNKPVDEPDLGDGAFSIHNINLDLQRQPFYVVEYYARKNAQIFSISFKRYQPFAPADFAAHRAAIKAFFDNLE